MFLETLFSHLTEWVAKGFRKRYEVSFPCLDYFSTDVVVGIRLGFGLMQQGFI
jgi:hypothetical protein